ncbi:MAG TPA: glycosyltransferase family 39 protein, partial [Abditibacteriaceae bacterium]
MHFLLDAALFLVLILALAGCALAAVRPGQGVLEGLVVHLLGLLGASAFVLWLTNSVFHLNFAFWPLLLPPLLLVLLHRHAGVSSPLSRIRRGFQTFERVDWALLLYVFGVSVLTFVLTLAPPNGADYDSLVYHLAAPQQYLRAGAVVELPYDHHSYFPFTMEMLFAFGLAARGAVFAKLFHWLMLPLACMALLAIGQRHLTRRAGLFAAALLASLPVVQIEASTAYIDLGLAAFSLGAVLCFCSWRETRSTRELLWCGAFCGFCLGTKYLGALTFGWIGIWVLVLAWSRRKSAGDITPVFGCAAIALVLGGGWYVRNFLWTGNPVFPFAYEVFGGKGWTAEMAKAYTRDQVEYGFGRGVLDWILLPWRLSMSPFNLT